MMRKSARTPDGSLTAFFKGMKVTILVASVVINILALAFPLLMLQLYDRILPFRSNETLLLLALTVLLAILIESVLRGVRSYVTAWVAARFEHRAMNAVVNRALAEPLHQFERKGTGILMDRFRSITTLKYHYSGQAFQQLLDLPFTALYVGVAALINPWIGLLLVLGYTVFMIITAFRGRGFSALVKQQKDADARRGNFLNESLTNIHTVKSMTMESLMLRRYERLQETCAHLLGRLAYRLDMSSGLGSVFSPLMTVLTVALGAWLVIDGQMTNGELAACVLLGMRSLAPLQRLGGLWSKYQQDRLLRTQLSEVLQEPALNESALREDETPNDPHGRNHPAEDQLAPRVQIRGLRYQFPSASAPIFKDLELDVHPGECLLISGSGGAGCTTLLQLIAGMIQPEQGQVLIDGKPPVTGASHPDPVRLAYLPASGCMFEGSLVENISLFDASRVQRAIETAEKIGLGSFVSRLPRGWDSMAGDTAVDSLPPGYRQRLALVRALSNDPNIILFDEATATIDMEGDSLFLKYLAAIKGQVTLIIVSQRPSFQRLADRTVNLDAGEITEVSPATSPAPDEKSRNTISTQQAAASRSVQSVRSIDRSSNDSASGKWKHLDQTISSQFTKPSDLAGCLAILLQLINAKQSAREVAEALPYYTESLDLNGFNNAMAQLGYRVIEMPGTLGSLDARSLPCLFVPDEGYAFVVMGRVGAQLRVNSDLADEPRLEPDLSLKGRAFFYEAFRPSVLQSKSWVRGILARFRPLLGQAAASSVVLGVLMVASPLFLIAVYSKVIPTGALDTLYYLSFGALVAVATCYFFVKHRARVLAHIAGRVEYLFGVTILKQVLQMSPTYTERASVGAQTARIRSFEAVRDLFTGPLASTVLELPATIVLLVALSIINPIALAVFLLMLGIFFVLYRIFESRARQRVALVNQTATIRNQFLVEMIGKMRAIRQCGAQTVWLERFRDVSAGATMAAFQAEQLSAFIASVSYLVMMISALTIVTVSVPAVWANAIPSGALIVSMILMWRVLTPAQTVFTNLTRLERVGEAVQQIDSLMKIQGERPDSAMLASTRGVEGGLEFARVSFRYSLNADPALIGVEFVIKPGQLVAVSGPNGGGKSTMLKLILGMYQPQAGAILLDNTDTRQLDPLELRRLVAYAPQEVQLFRATLLQNLRMSKPDATDQDVLEALSMAGALDQVNALPMGIDYRVGDNTNELGASLLQKLSLARAYLTQAPILLVDESAAGLDLAGDQAFMQSLELMRGKRTVIFITHRPSHMRMADILLIFDKGYLRASGPPEKLLKQVTAA